MACNGLCNDTCKKVQYAQEKNALGEPKESIAQALGVKESRVRELVGNYNWISKAGERRRICSVLPFDADQGRRVNLNERPTVERRRSVVQHGRGIARRMTSTYQFSGTLSEYLKHMQKFLIEASRMVNWQRLVNEYCCSTDSKWFMGRYGISNWSICGNIYDLKLEDGNHCHVVTTDNEATVSFYEHCRKKDRPDGSLKVLEYLKSGAIKTGTIKGFKDPDERLEIDKKRSKFEIAGAGGFPTNDKPYPMLKYSHMGDAKKNIPQDLNERSLACICTSRTLSPMNIFMTHTGSGNTRFRHEHRIDGRPSADIGEEEDIRQYFVAAIADHVKNIDDGLSTLFQFLQIARLKIGDLGDKWDQTAVSQNFEKLIKDAENIEILIEPSNLSAVG